MKKRVKIFFITVLSLSAFMPFVKAQEEQQPKIRTDIVGIVDNRYLRMSELNKRIEKFLSTQKSQQQSEEKDEAFRRYAEGKILDEWINIALLAAEAEKRGYTVSNEELNKKIEALHSEYAPNLDIEAALQKAGYTRDEFMLEMRDALLGEKLIADYISKNYTEKQLQDVYRQDPSLFIKPPQVRVLHIFRSLHGLEPKEELKRIEKEMEEIRSRALKGEDFHKLAQESDGLARYRGGDLGWLTPDNRLPEPINSLIFKVKPGKVSKVTMDKKGYGFHLIKVQEKNRATGLTFEEARPDVETYVFNQIKSALIEQLKQQHRVVTNLSGIPESIAFTK